MSRTLIRVISALLLSCLFVADDYTPLSWQLSSAAATQNDRNEGASVEQEAHPFPPHRAGVLGVDYNGGPVMGTTNAGTTLHVIYWTPRPYSFPAGYEAALNRFAGDVAAGSQTNDNDLGVITQYYELVGRTRTYIRYLLHLAPPITDTRRFPALGCLPDRGFASCLTDRQVGQEVTSLSPLGLSDRGLSQEWTVLFPPGVELCMFDQDSAEGGDCSSNTGLCGFHDETMTRAGSILVYSALPWPEACGGARPTAWGVLLTARVSASGFLHELLEAMTDPIPGTVWTDPQGQEVADLCVKDRSWQRFGSGRWFVQDVFSDAPYEAHKIRWVHELGPRTLRFDLSRVSTAGARGADLEIVKSRLRQECGLAGLVPQATPWRPWLTDNVGQRMAGEEDTRVLRTEAERLLEVGDLAGALGTYEQALSIDSSTDPGSRDTAGDLSGMANVFCRRGLLDLALGFYGQSLDIFETVAPGSLDSAGVLCAIGALQRERGEPALALRYFERSLEVLDQLAPGSLDSAGVLCAIGALQRERGEPALALRYFERSLEVLDQLAPASLDSAGVLCAIGALQRERGEPALALRYFERSLEVLDQLAPGSLDSAGVLCAIGALQRERGEPALALRYFERSLEVLDQLAPRFARLGRRPVRHRRPPAGAGRTGPGIAVLRAQPGGPRPTGAGFARLGRRPVRHRRPPAGAGRTGPGIAVLRAQPGTGGYISSYGQR